MLHKINKSEEVQHTVSVRLRALDDGHGGFIWPSKTAMNAAAGDEAGPLGAAGTSAPFFSSAGRLDA